MKITLCILARNELPCLKIILPQLPKPGGAFDDWVAIDGGSTDGTVDFLQAHGVPVIAQSRRGRGDAFLQAFAKLDSDAFVFFSPDGNEDPKDLPQFRKHLESGADLVIASRMMKGARNEEDDHFFKWRKWANNAFNLLANLFFRQRGPYITDTINGYRAITRDAARKLQLDSLDYTIEYQMSCRALNAGLRIDEFPTIEGPRVAGDTGAPSLPTGIRFLKKLGKEICLYRGWQIGLLAGVMGLSVLTLPSQLYPGDNHGIRLAAANFYITGSLGIDYLLRDNLYPYLTNRGQVFIENDQKKKFYSRWGDVNTLIFAIPELWRRPQQVKMSDDMVDYANAQNLALVFFSALYLIALTRMFGATPLSAVTFVMVTLFGTFEWTYLRAQSYEILHLALFLAMFYHFVFYVRGGGRRHYIIAQVLLLILALSKSTFFVVYPAVWLADLQQSRWAWRKATGWIAGFAAVTLALHIWSIYLKTGILSLSSEGAAMEGTSDVFAVKNILPRLYEYTISQNGSVFLLSPPVLFALFFVRRFWREFRSETIFVAVTLFLTLAILLPFYSRGQLCYGPRYLVFLLPVLSLPLILGFNRFPWMKAVLVGISAVMFYFHFEFNSRPFFLAEQFPAWSERPNGAPAREYVVERNYALMVRDFNNYLAGKTNNFPPLEIYMNDQPSLERRRFISEKMDHELPCNFYFEFLCPKVQ